MTHIENKYLLNPMAPEVFMSSGYNAVKQKENVFLFYNAGRGCADTLEFKEKSIDDIYNKIEKVLDEYRIDVNLAKDVGLLEEISGCSTKELLLKSDNELNVIFNALKMALTRDWKAFWKDRDIDDIKEIAKDANAQYIRSLTGGNWIGQKFDDFWNESTLTKQLEKDGFLNKNEGPNYGEENLKKATIKFFKTKYLAGLENLSEEEQLEKYKLALSKFGYIINRCSSTEERVVLTSVIAELATADRKLAIKALLASTGGKAENKAKEKSIVAKSIDINDITTRADATGKVCSKEEATEISSIKYASMTEEDVKEALAELGVEAQDFFIKYEKQLKAIDEKLAGYSEKDLTDSKLKELLTKEELELYYLSRNAYVAQWSGSIVGVVENQNNFENKAEIINTIIVDVSECGKIEELAKNLLDFITTKPLEEKNVIDKTFEDVLGKDLKTFLEKIKETKMPEFVEMESINDVPASSVLVKNPELLEEYSISVEDIKIPQSTETLISSENKVIPITTETELIVKKSENNCSLPIDENKKQNELPPKSLKDASSMGVRALNSYIAENGHKRTVIELVSDNKTQHVSRAFLDKCVAIFKNSFSTSEQKETLLAAKNSYLTLLLNSASNKTLNSLEGKIFNNHYATEHVKEAIRENKEQKA